MRRSTPRSFCRLSVEQLDRRLLMAADIIPEIETNNTESQATRFALVAGQQVRLQGTSQSKDDKDYFAFTAADSMQINLDATAASTAKLEVTTRAGVQLFETEPKDGLVKGRWSAQAGETYLVRLRADKGAATYDVLLGAASSSSTDDNPQNDNTQNGGNGNTGASSSGPEVEPNDRQSTATRTSLTSTAPLELTGSASKRDRDFFHVQAASAGIVSIDTGSSGIKVSIESVSGLKLFESEPRDGQTRGSFEVTAGQAFLVRARGITNSVTAYSLNLTLSNSHELPATAPTQPLTTSPTTSPDVWLDCSDDGTITALDALLVINHINDSSHSHGTDDALLSLDTNDDRIVSALDALLVVNRINDPHHGEDVNDAFDDSDIRRRRA